MACTGCAARRARAVKWLMVAAERVRLLTERATTTSQPSQPAKSEPPTE